MVNLNHYWLAYLAGETVGNAVATYKNMRYNQNQMQQDNKIGADNFYHAKAACEATQQGLDSMSWALAGGVAKEVRDLYCKTQGRCGERQINFSEAWNDSKKDMLNNFLGADLGLKNKNTPCRVLINDYRTKHNKEIY